MRISSRNCRLSTQKSPNLERKKTIDQISAAVGTIAEPAFNTVPSSRKRRRTRSASRQGTESILKGARRTLFRCADVTTRRNVDTVLYGDTFLTESTRPSRMSLHGRVCCILLGRQNRRLRSCGGRRSRSYSRRSRYLWRASCPR